MTKTLKSSTDIARSPHDVFSYVADAAHLPDWQPTVEEAAADTNGSPGVGMHGWEVRRVPGGPRKMRWEVTEYEPGSRYGVKGTDGPVRAHVSIELTPTEVGTHVDHSVWFEGHGIGKVIRLFAQQGARKEVPATLRLLKERLERSE